MKLIDWVLLALIGFAVVLAMRSVLKHGGVECNGNCCGCSGCASKERRSFIGGASSKANAQRAMSLPDMEHDEQPRREQT